ncbi:MAG TPA: MerR family transcriptional regulator, partial [Pelobium sp.]|nr:MerR family transcriptional regulator [Pelobium sp.]
KEIEKSYYPIGEVAEMFNVNTSMIRFYEKEFDVLQPKKNAKGNRLFRPEDINNLKIIFNLIKDKGFTLQGAKDFMKKNKKEVDEKQKVLDALEKIKSFMIDLKEQL